MVDKLRIIPSSVYFLFLFASGADEAIVVVPAAALVTVLPLAPLWTLFWLLRTTPIPLNAISLVFVWGGRTRLAFLSSTSSWATLVLMI